MRPTSLLLAILVASMASATITKKPWGTADGKAVCLFTLTDPSGMRVDITNYGATVVRLFAPDKNGKYGDVVCGYDTLAEYLKGSPYFGCIVGRYGNRIAKGRFTLDGKTYKLAINNGPNSLHGGKKGFDKRVWTAAVKGDELHLTYVSADGDEGYPGKLTARVTYSLEGDSLRIDYAVTTTKATVVNLTNHCYFNLGGAEARDCLDHSIMINADKFTPVDSTLIPTGVLKSVSGTPFDFRKPTAIGARIASSDQQVQFGGGYDHNFVLRPPQKVPGVGEHFDPAVIVHEPVTGRTMTVLTSEPGVQFYSGNFLDSSNVGKGGRVYNYRYAFCLETQHFPDSPNHPKFPTTVLRPGKSYKSTTWYAFSAK